MRTLVTFPGRYGDLLWALPAVRALSRRLGEPVDLLIAEKYGSLAPLIEQQSYIRHCLPDRLWQVAETAPMTPRTPPGLPDNDGEGVYDLILHLGYRGWPARPLPFETLDCLRMQWPCGKGSWADTWGDEELALDEPWITVAPWTQVPHPLVVGWSDEHFELKYGLTHLLALNLTAPGSAFVLCAPGSRWQTEGGFTPTDWIENARRIAAAEVFLGCCSALHVLAVALGKPVVIMEPAEARHNPIFYPLGTTGRVRLVLGGDGKPTWDARHVKDAIEEALRAQV